MKPVLLFGVCLAGACLGIRGEPVPGRGERAGGAESKPWAFQSPRRHAMPGVREAGWAKRPLDHFILAALERRGLRPVRPATKGELIRRATFDLTGLPPTPEACDAFERDLEPTAFAKVVDRLLASPHYGERWGRYWLDVARYADDQGNSFLTPTPGAYLYRDWVVNAFNRDLPFDEFVRLQIAGDELPGRATDYVERLAGLGFQGLGPQFRKGAAGEAKAKADELEDRVDTMTRGILGLTVSCARCHDHKFDPIPTRDYYSLAAAYHGAEWPSRMLAAPEIVEAHRQWEAEVEGRRAALKKWSDEQALGLGLAEVGRLDAYVTIAAKVLVAQHHQLPVDIVALAKQEGLQVPFLRRWVEVLGKPGDEPLLKPLRERAGRSKELGAVLVTGEMRQEADLLKKAAQAAVLAQRAHGQASTEASGKPPAPSAEQEKLLAVLLKDAKAPFFVPEKDRDGLLDEAQRKHRAGLEARVDEVVKHPPASGPMMPSIRGGGQPMRIFVRGDPEKLGEAAPPGFLRILGGGAGAAGGGTFGRLDLANALASPQNPLTARVFVNRVWHYHFGRGIVSTLGNFGGLGSPPTHPEMLDTLAVGFMEAGWSVKWLHRELMLSATYQLGSVPSAENLAVDPGNEYLWRMTPRRLDFEAWRDALLAVAGRLDSQVGGPSIDQAVPGIKDVAGFNFFTRLNGVEADDRTGRRRTLYTVVSRYAPNATLTLFDFPEPNVASDQRHATTVPQQQLFVLNSPFMMETSRAFARRLEGGAAGVRDRVELGWRLAYGRTPTAGEASMADEFLQSASGSADAGQLAPWEQLAHALLASNELMFVP